jgi:hypothetical protein
MIWGMLAFFSNFEIIERLLFLWPSVILTAVTSFFLGKFLFKSNWARILCSLVYTYNTYFILGRSGSLTLEVSYSLVPLLFLMYIYFLEKLNWRYALYVLLVGSIISFYEFRAFYLALWVCIFYYLYEIIFFQKERWKKVFLGPLPFVLILICNLFWILPLVTADSMFSNVILSRGLFGNQFMNILRSMSLFHPFWSGGKLISFLIQPIPYYFFIIPIFAFLGFILNRKNKYIMFFGIISVIGIFLGKQADDPFPKVYEWLYFHLPGFGAFREASKMYFFIAFGYSVLVASFVDRIWQNTSKFKNKNIVPMVCTLSIFVVFLINTRPIFTTELGSILLDSKVPEDYLVFKEYIINNNSVSKVFWFPKDSRWSIYTSRHQKVSGLEMVQNLWINILSPIKNKPIEKQIASSVEKNFSNFIFDISNIQYVVIPIQDVSNNDDFYINYGGKDNENIRKWYVDSLDKIPWLTKIDIGLNELVVYENQNYKEPIYTFDTLFDLDTTKNLEHKSSLVTENLRKDFYFNTLSSANKDNLVSISNIFETIKSDYFVPKSNQLVAKPQLPMSKKSYITLRNLPDGGKGSLGKENEFTYTNKKYSYANIIQNPSFENGLWQEKVGDCNNSDKNPILKMSLSTETQDGGNALQLEAARHTACTNIKIPVKPNSKYQLSFDYQSPNSKVATWNIFTPSG